MIHQIHHGTLFTGNGVYNNQILRIKDDLVDSILPWENTNLETGDFNAEGLLIAPAFIDLQLYGASGLLFNNHPREETLEAIHRLNLQGGTTRYMVTLSTSSWETTLLAIEVVRKALAKPLPGLLGLHLEGPFLNPEKRGAHFEKWILKPSIPLIQEILNKGKGIVKMMTIAPEMFDESCLVLLQRSGIILSAGHSMASYDQAQHGFNKGIRLVTHLYNAMSPLGSREPGLVGASLDHPSAVASIIPDGIHCHFRSLKIASKLMGNQLFFITDSVTENSEGPYKFYKGENCYINEMGTLAGSALSMLNGVKNAVKYAGISLEEALRMASTYPSRQLNDSNITGILASGKKADILVFNSEFELIRIYYEGKMIQFKKKDEVPNP